MPTFTTQVIRIACDITSKENVLDLNTSAEPQAWWARDLTVQAGVFSGQALLDVSDLQSVTINIKDASNLDGTPLVSKTVTAFDNTTTGATWQAGTQQHFSVAFTADDLSFGGLTNGQRLVHLSLVAVTTGGQTGTLCVGQLNIIDDGGNSPSSNPVNAITVAQAQAMVAALGFANALISPAAAGTTSIQNSQSWLSGRAPVSVQAGAGAYVANLTLSHANVIAGAVLRVPIDFAASVNGTLNVYDGTTGGTLLLTVTQIDGVQARNFFALFGYDGGAWHLEERGWQI
jgi:hypothetical protein